MSSSAAAGDSADTPLKVLRRLLLLKKPADLQAQPLMIPSSSSSFPPSPEPAKKMGFAAAAFRGLGCASSSSSQAFAPAAAAVRSSADWHHQSRRQPSRKRRPSAKHRKKKDRDRKGASSSSAVDDVWCAPGIAFGAADPPLDCVVPHPAGGRGRSDADRIHRERPYISRRVGDQERIHSFMDSPTALEAPLFGQDILSSGHLRRLRGYRRSPGGLEEIMMFQTRILLGGMDAYDQYRDLRLDVDNMSYEELLELGDRIGYVSTGLREEEIFRNLRKMKHMIFDESSRRFSPEMERKCSICQEEYEDEDEMGSLECGHSYHLYCIKQWLIQKNACPVCKTAVTKS